MGALQPNFEEYHKHLEKVLTDVQGHVYRALDKIKEENMRERVALFDFTTSSFKTSSSVGLSSLSGVSYSQDLRISLWAPSAAKPGVAKQGVWTTWW